MTHTHHPGIVAIWRLKINRKHYIEVFIWQDRESLWAAKDYNTSFESQKHNQHKHNYIGDATALGWAEDPDTGKTVGIPRKFGEIFLIKDLYRTNVASHEIAHIVNYWGNCQHWEPYGKDDEKVAKLTGRLNAQFWTCHFKVFP